jgi:hypothetical protein
VTRGAEKQLLQLTPTGPSRRLLPQGWHAWLADGEDALALPGPRLLVPAVLLLAAAVGLWRLLGSLRTRRRSRAAAAGPVR